MNATEDDTAAGTARGLFITFEGGEGAGKSTQIRLLAEKLRGRGHDIVLTREPGGSPLAETLRSVLLSGKAAAYGPEAEAMLFSAARADHVDTLIRPALASGRWVLCDRFADSTRVYQGVVGAVPAATVATLESLALDGLKPDLTIVLDLPAEIGLVRAAARRGGDSADRFERETLAIHEARRQGFLDLAKAEPTRFVVIDGVGTPDEVAARLWEEVERRLFAS